MRYLKIFTLCGLFLWAASLPAAQVSGLYEAEVEVADQGTEVRGSAMRDAMAAVLIKVSGSTSVPQEEVLQEAMADAARYVRQYRYRNDTTAASTGQNRLLLWVSFDSNSIDTLLRRFGFSVWGGARPDTLIWLAVEDGSRRVLVGANDQGLVRELLDAESQRRAIPIRLPLLDLKDQSRVRAVDVWGGFVDNIETASQRYEAPAVLIGKLYRMGKGWTGRWILRYQGEQHEWREEGTQVNQVIASGIDGTSDRLAQYYAASNHLGIEQLVLRIEGVASMNDFRRVSDYLHSLHGVQTVTLRRIDANSSSFLLVTEGNLASVLQVIAMGDTLMEVKQPVSAVVPTPAWRTEPAGAARVVPVTAPYQPAADTVADTGQDERSPGAAPGLQDGIASLEASPQPAPLQEHVYRLLH